MGIKIALIALCLVLLIAFLWERKRRMYMRLVLLKEAEELKKTNDIASAILKSVHAFVLLIDRDFTVLKTNYYRRTGIKKGTEEKKVGDLLQCRNALYAVGGCGTHELCGACPVRRAITAAFAGEESFSDLEARLNVCISEHESVECDVSVSGSFLKLNDEDCMVLTVHDITRQKEAERALVKA